MSEYPTNDHLLEQPTVTNTGGRFKRVLFLLTMLTQMVGYVVITQVRYEGQGLVPIYFRMMPLSDTISILFYFIILLFLVRAIINPKRIGSMRAMIVTILSGVLLWVDLGIRHTAPEDFTPEAATALLMAMFLLLAMLFSTSQRSTVSILRRIRVVFRNAVSMILVVLFASFLYGYFFKTYSEAGEISAFHADAGVILGAAVWHGNGLGERPSPALRERINLGNELLISHAIPRLVVTGGSGPGKLAEAEVAKLELLHLGVDSSRIIEENSSHTTFEQVRFLRDELYRKQGWSRFVILSDQYHLARVCEMCRYNGLTVIGSPSHIHEPILDLAYYRIRESVAMLEYWLLGR